MRSSQSENSLSKQFPSGSFDKLIEEATQFMRDRGYKENSIKDFRNRWRRFARFVRERYGDDFFTVERSRAFIESEGIDLDYPEGILRPTQRSTRAAMRVMTELVIHGSAWRPYRKSSLDGFASRWKVVSEDYREYLVKSIGWRVPTAERTYGRLKPFLRFLTDREIRNPENIKERHISEYLTSRSHLKQITLHTYACDISRFMSYLYLNDLHPADLSKAMPKIPRGRNAALPAIWTSEEVERLLAAVDHASPCGKRNYAVLLLAARLGMRLGDIKRMRFENLRWEENRIVMTQSKTDEPLVLPLTDEIGTAIIDYLKNGRPVSEHREVFLSMHTPFAPLGDFFDFSRIIACYRHRAGLRFEREKRCGIHSLRHTLASRLLEAGTPMRTIADILGHASIESTKNYLKIDINTLRRAALEIEEA